MADQEAIDQGYRQTMFTTLSGLVGAPLIFAYLVYVTLSDGSVTIHNRDWLLYLGLAMSAAAGAVRPILRRGFLTSYHTRPTRYGSVFDAARTFTVIQMGLIEFSYVMGLAIFFLTGQRTGMPIFYALGIYFSILYWPTKSRFRALIEQLEAK